MSIHSTQNLPIQRKRDFKQRCAVFPPAWWDSGTQCLRTMQIPGIEESFPAKESCSPNKPQKSLPYEGKIFPQDGICKIPKISDEFKIYLICISL